jgi:dihydroorotase
MIARDIELLKYTQSKLHITAISTKKSLDLINKAKQDGLQISCSVTPYHLHFCDEDLDNYDTNLKVNPPLRTREDMMALRLAFKNNEIDTLASHHIPQHSDNKICEFEYAGFGMIGLETLFSVALNYAKDINSLITLLSINNRKLFNLPVPAIEENAAACLTLFNLDKEYDYSIAAIKSKSKNSAFINNKLKAEVLGIINKNHLILKDEN